MAEETYEGLLVGIKDQYSNPLTRVFPLSENEKIYHIDLNTRAIESPSSIGVQNDHQSDYIFFEIDRYYERTDLANTIGIITYVNAQKEQFIYVIPFYDVNSHGADKIVFPWCIQSPLTKYSGKIEYAIKFFQVNSNNEIIFDLNTLKAGSVVQKGWSTNSLEYDFSSTVSVDPMWKDVIDQMRSLLDERSFEIKWEEASNLIG